jgi:hypothetical protein
MKSKLGCLKIWEDVKKGFKNLTKYFKIWKM